MKQLRRIALVSANYPPLHSEGIDVQTYDLAHLLSDQDIDVTVFCGGSKIPTLTHEKENLHILSLPMHTFPPRVVWFQTQNLAALRNLLRDFDLVHTQHSSGSFYGFLKERKQPWIVSFHDHQLRRLRFFSTNPVGLSPKDLLYYTFGYPVFESLTQMELKRADHYIVCGASGFRDYVSFSGMNPDKTTVIPNGIHLEKIKLILGSSDFKVSKEKGNFTIFTCGRLYASKGIQYLIRAMPQVVANFNDVYLKIFGKGPMRSYLQGLIHSLNLERNVSLEGHVPYNRLIHEMNNCDLAVFPSMIEVGASLAVMEAMACRKAVVAFKYPFSTEIIDHLKTGWHVPPKNVEALASAICILIGDNNLRKRLGENAFQNIVQNHDYTKIIKKYLAVYSNAVGA